jgi:hypothetical protein
MKLGNKRFWIALFAVIFLSSKVAAAVQLCVHDMPPVGDFSAAEAHGWPNSGGTGECCDAQLQTRYLDAADCCAEVVPARRGGGPHCCPGGAALKILPAAYWPVPHVAWRAALPAALPLHHVAGPPFAIVFKNFRS